MSGLELAEMLRKVVPSVLVILITVYGSIENYFRSPSLDAFQYVCKTMGKRELGMIVKTALQNSEKNRS